MAKDNKKKSSVSKNKKIVKKRNNIDKNKSKSFNKIYLTFETRFIMKIILCLILFVFAGLFLFLGLRINFDSNLRYYQTSNLDYKVNLKDNDYYEEKQLGKDMSYIASLIDSIDVDFNYNFKVSEKINYKYSYYINAETVVRNVDSKNVIFSRKDNIIPEKTIALNDNDSFNINEKVNIDYGLYNTKVKSFKSEYALDATSDLIVTLYVKVMDEEGNTLKTLKADNKMNIIIPLTEQTIDIEMDYQEINNSDVFIVHTDVSIGNKILFAIGVVICIFFIISLVGLIKFISKLSRKKTPYNKLLSKILREYDRIIVESKKNILIDDNQDIIDVKSFNELLDARDNLEKPIVFHEIHKNEKSIFIVKNSYEVYRYVLKAVDLENQK